MNPVVNVVRRFPHLHAVEVYVARAVEKESCAEFRRRLEQAAVAYKYRGTRGEPSPPNLIQFPDEDRPEGDSAEDRLSSTRPFWRRLLHVYPFVAQHDETDCGAACLAMITAYHGVPVGVARLRDLAFFHDQFSLFRCEVVANIFLDDRSIRNALDRLDRAEPVFDRNQLRLKGVGGDLDTVSSFR